MTDRTYVDRTYVDRTYVDRTYVDRPNVDFAVRGKLIGRLTLIRDSAKIGKIRISDYNQAKPSATNGYADSYFSDFGLATNQRNMGSVSLIRKFADSMPYKLIKSVAS